MALFLMLARDDGSAFGAMSPAEAQAVIEKYIAWSDRLRTSGKLKTGEKLKDQEGRVVANTNGRIGATDGPFCEAKEVVGGLWIIEARDYDEMVAIAGGCPHAQFGTLEIRAIEDLGR